MRPARTFHTALEAASADVGLRKTTALGTMNPPVVVGVTSVGGVATGFVAGALRAVLAGGFLPAADAGGAAAKATATSSEIVQPIFILNT